MLQPSLPAASPLPRAWRRAQGPPLPDPGQSDSWVKLGLPVGTVPAAQFCPNSPQDKRLSPIRNTRPGEPTGSRESAGHGLTPASDALRLTCRYFSVYQPELPAHTGLAGAGVGYH